ncbi:DUF1698 domain-containing protein [Salmonella enterica]
MPWRKAPLSLYGAGISTECRSDGK